MMEEGEYEDVSNHKTTANSSTDNTTATALLSATLFAESSKQSPNVTTTTTIPNNDSGDSDSDNSDNAQQQPKQTTNRGFVHNVLMPYYQLLKQRKGYRFIWIAAVISYIGDWLNEIACIVILGNYLNSSVSVALLLVAKEIPPFLLSPIVGVVADTYNRARILVISDIARMIVVLGFLFSNSASTAWMVFVLTFLQSSFSAFFRPAEVALVPSLAGKEHIVTANSLENSTWSGMLMVGAAIGAFVTAGLGIYANFLIDSASYLASALIVSRLLYMPGLELYAKEEESGSLLPSDSNKTEFSDMNDAKTDSDTDTSDSASTSEALLEEGGKSSAKQENWIQTYKEGFLFLLRNKYILALVFAKASGSLVWGGIDVAMIRIAQDPELAGGLSPEIALGIIYSTSGLGVFLPPIFTKWFVKDESPSTNLKMLMFGLVTHALTSIVTGLSTSVFAIECLVNILRCAASNIVWIYSSSLIQQLVESKYLGRVFSFDFAMMTFASVCSKLLGGFLLDNFGWPPGYLLLLLSVIGCFVAAIWAVSLKVFKCHESQVYVNLETSDAPVHH